MHCSVCLQYKPVQACRSRPPRAVTQTPSFLTKKVTSLNYIHPLGVSFCLKQTSEPPPHTNRPQTSAKPDEKNFSGVFSSSSFAKNIDRRWNEIFQHQVMVGGREFHPGVIKAVRFYFDCCRIIFWQTCKCLQTCSSPARGLFSDRLASRGCLKKEERKKTKWQIVYYIKRHVGSNTNNIKTCWGKKKKKNR